MLPLRQAEIITSDKDIESYNCYGYAIKRKTLDLQVEVECLGIM